MVMTWSLETDDSVVGVNINDTIHKNLTPPEGLAKVVRNFSPSMGRINGVAFTETAPLVFPASDKLDESHGDEAKSTKEKMSACVGVCERVLRSSCSGEICNYSPLSAPFLSY